MKAQRLKEMTLDGLAGALASLTVNRATSLRAADKLANLFLKRELTEKEMSIAGPTLQILFGVGAGVIYGMTKGKTRAVAKVAGTLYGAGAKFFRNT